MKKAAVLFILAIIIPSLVLARMSLRSADTQELALANQRKQVHRGAIRELSRSLDDVIAGIDRTLRETGDTNWPPRDDSLAMAKLTWELLPDGELKVTSSKTPDEALRFLTNYGPYFSGQARSHFAKTLTERPAPEPERDISPMVAAADIELDSMVPPPTSLAPPRPLKKERAAETSRTESFEPRAQSVENSAPAAPQTRRVVRSRSAKAPVGGSAQNLESASGQALESATANEQESAQFAAAADHSPPQSARSLPPLALDEEASDGSKRKSGATGQIAADAQVGYNAERGTVPQIHTEESPSAPLPSRFTPRFSSFLESATDAFSGVFSFENDQSSSTPAGPIFWVRSQMPSRQYFGILLDPGWLQATLQPVLHDEARASGIEIAVLDHRGQPFLKSSPRFVPSNWRTPFAAIEIGEALPRWEIATYLKDPNAIGKAARSAKIDLALVVLAIVAAIGFGSALIFIDIKRQMAAARQKSDFVSSVSHELKTPLTSIRMFSDLLANGEDSDAEKTKRYASVIGTEAARLTRLIDNVLDFAQIERGDKRYHFEKLSLDELLQEIAAHFRPQLETAGFELRVAIEPSIQNLMLHLDRDAMSQVLVNLLSNAEKYGGGTEKVIDLCAKAKGAQAIIEVSDRGPGVPPGHERRIFEKFHRADDSLANSARGSGLGLALASEIVKAHGGELHYQKRDGGGSTFLVILPSERTQDSESHHHA